MRAATGGECQRRKTAVQKFVTQREVESRRFHACDSASRQIERILDVREQFCRIPNWVWIERAQHQTSKLPTSNPRQSHLCQPLALVGGASVTEDGALQGAFRQGPELVLGQGSAYPVRRVESFFISESKSKHLPKSISRACEYRSLIHRPMTGCIPHQSGKDASRAAFAWSGPLISHLTHLGACSFV